MKLRMRFFQHSWKQCKMIQDVQGVTDLLVLHRQVVLPLGLHDGLPHVLDSVKSNAALAGHLKSSSSWGGATQVDHPVDLRSR